MRQYFNKKTIIITLLIILVLLTALIWWLWVYSRRSLNPDTIDRVTVQTPSIVTTSTAPTIEYRPGDEMTVIARNVIERYGSYSNQTAGQNVEDIRTLVTPELYQRLRLENQPVTDEYRGIDTRVLSAKVMSQSASAAVLELSTQRSQRQADLSTIISYQKVTVGLRVAGEGWLINSIQWQ